MVACTYPAACLKAPKKKRIIDWICLLVDDPNSISIIQLDRNIVAQLLSEERVVVGDEAVFRILLDTYSNSTHITFQEIVTHGKMASFQVIVKQASITKNVTCSMEFKSAGSSSLLKLKLLILMNQTHENSSI